MPVDPDYRYANESHESTIEQPGTKWGCWNVPRARCYYAPTRSYLAGNQAPYVESQVPVEDTMSVACMHRRTTPGDPKCEGCTK